MWTYVAIAVGGATGSVLRYFVHRTIERWWPADPFPLGTFTVNVLGCFLIGLLSALLLGPWPVRDTWRLGLTVGLLGGFTTFSTFGLETFRLLHMGQLRYALIYVLASCLAGILAVWAGERLMQAVAR